MAITPSASYSFTVRLEIRNKPGMLGRVTSVIGKAGGDIGAVDLAEMTTERVLRDITIKARDSRHAHLIIDRLKTVAGTRIVNISDRTFLMHLGGKIEIKSKVPIRTRDDLSMAYTPGVARVCLAIKDDPGRAFTLTMKQNTVAVVTDGTAVLGLGDIGLGGINLEDISAPRCFEVEERLRKELDIPVFHDDQHGTAVVVAGALLNALKIVGKDIRKLKVVVSGVGAAGTAVVKMLLALGARNIVGVDEHGTLYRGRPVGMDFMKTWVAGATNPQNVQGKMSDAIKGADVFIGLSVPRVLTVRDVKSMARERIVFAMANPVPEIQPEEVERHVRVMATGRSDYPNQINNVLCFPGLFRGLLDSRARLVNDEMKVAAAHAIASCVGRTELGPEYIIPSVFNKKVAPAVAREVARAAQRTGVARRRPRMDSATWW
ncbi:MAG: NAD-dependent malic enzyme [Candidatus Rokuibacteriota bacterium]|nr:MAG: NAD-dependent malic enzyme [Candidatus Rokubacteria bacterium]